jgi:hypothetical protein
MDNIIFYPNLPKIVPLKSTNEKELFDKWRHILSRKKVSVLIVKLYNKDLEIFLASEEGKKYKEQNVAFESNHTTNK